MGPEGCEDVVQDVLLTIHLKRQTWREDAALRPWLYAVTRHKVIDAFRARGQRVDVDIDDFAETLAAPEGADPFHASDMARVIDRLEPRAAQIVRAIGIDGASAAEASAGLAPAIRARSLSAAESAGAAASPVDSDSGFAGCGAGMMAGLGSSA